MEQGIFQQEQGNLFALQGISKQQQGIPASVTADKPDEVWRWLCDVNRFYCESLAIRRWPPSAVSMAWIVWIF